MAPKAKAKAKAKKFSYPGSHLLEGARFRGHAHGGARPNAGRKPKDDADNYTQVTCVLRNDTLEKLREGANSKFFGAYLQCHLDRFPLPSHEEYLAIRDNVPLYKLIKRRKVPVIISGQRPRAIKTKKTAAQLAREKFLKDFTPV
jgi:hypothetical protein